MHIHHKNRFLINNCQFLFSKVETFFQETKICNTSYMILKTELFLISLPQHKTFRCGAYQLKNEKSSQKNQNYR